AGRAWPRVCRYRAPPHRHPALGALHGRWDQPAWAPGPGRRWPGAVRRAAVRRAGAASAGGCVAVGWARVSWRWLPRYSLGVAGDAKAQIVAAVAAVIAERQAQLGDRAVAPAGSADHPKLSLGGALGVHQGLGAQGRFNAVVIMDPFRHIVAEAVKPPGVGWELAHRGGDHLPVPVARQHPAEDIGGALVGVVAGV